MGQSGLMLRSHPASVLKVHTHHYLYKYEVSDDVTLSSVDELRDLGVTMSADLSWGSHIGKIVSRGRSSAFWVMSVFGSREEEVMMTLYKSFVRSQLEYCSLLWHPQKIGDIEVIESVQRASRRGYMQLISLTTRRGSGSLS